MLPAILSGVKRPPFDYEQLIVLKATQTIDSRSTAPLSIQRTHRCSTGVNPPQELTRYSEQEDSGAGNTTVQQQGGNEDGYEPCHSVGQTDGPRKTIAT